MRLKILKTMHSDSSQEEEIEDDDIEYVEENDSESRNCYAVKKSGAKWNTYKNSNQEVPYFQVS